jgi:hypothetical protein
MRNNPKIGVLLSTVLLLVSVMFLGCPATEGKGDDTPASQDEADLRTKDLLFPPVDAGTAGGDRIGREDSPSNPDLAMDVPETSLPFPEETYCESNEECGEGLICRANIDDMGYGRGGFEECFDGWDSYTCGICQPPGDGGVYCDEDADCLDELACGLSSNICWFHCVIPTGGACDPDDEWFSGEWSICDDGGECVEHGDGSFTCS